MSKVYLYLFKISNLIYLIVFDLSLSINVIYKLEFFKVNFEKIRSTFGALHVNFKNCYVICPCDLFSADVRC